MLPRARFDLAAAQGRAAPTSSPRFATPSPATPGRPLQQRPECSVARSLRGLVKLLDDLGKAGIVFRSATEPFDTATPAGRMVVQVLGVFAEFERATIIDRIVAGMERKAARECRAWRRRLPALCQPALRTLHSAFTHLPMSERG